MRLLDHWMPTKKSEFYNFQRSQGKRAFRRYKMRNWIMFYGHFIYNKLEQFSNKI
jgi:hypothetical protein